MHFEWVEKRESERMKRMKFIRPHAVPEAGKVCSDCRWGPHASAYTREAFQNRGIRPVFWSADSPDLNPIEAVWD
jgi:putative component of membrane protein insertase Oxa1/YidC/SpoIIIJ protein YidD